MDLHPEPKFRPIAVREIVPRSMGTRSQRINPWIGADAPAATICGSSGGYELKEAAIRPTQQKYRVLTGQERGHGHFGLIRVDPARPCPTIQSSVGGSTTGLIHPYEIRHLTISEIKLMSSFPTGFSIEGSFADKWARIGNSVPPLLMRAIAGHLRQAVIGK